MKKPYSIFRIETESSSSQVRSNLMLRLHNKMFHYKEKEVNGKIVTIGKVFKDDIFMFEEILRKERGRIMVKYAKYNPASKPFKTHLKYLKKHPSSRCTYAVYFNLERGMYEVKANETERLGKDYTDDDAKLEAELDGYEFRNESFPYKITKSPNDNVMINYFDIVITFDGYYGKDGYNYDTLMSYLGTHNIISASELSKDLIIHKNDCFTLTANDERFLRDNGYVILPRECKLQDKSFLEGYEDFMKWYKSE